MRSSHDKTQPRWTLMLIGDHGKVIELKHIRWLIAGTLLLLSCAVLAAALLFVNNKKLSGETDKLRRSLETSRAQVLKVRQQTELLMAQLALAEARARGASGEQPPPPANDPDAAAVSAADARPSVVKAVPSKAAGESPPKSDPVAAVTPVVNPKPEAAPGPQADPAEKSESAAVAEPSSARPEAGAAEKKVMVEIDGLELRRPPGSETLKLEFKVKNVSPTPQRIEGRVMAILRGDNLPPARWIPIPDVKLVDGRPAEVRGHRFAINNWRTMRMRRRFAGDLEPYNLVEIYVYSMKGDVWLREIEPVKPQ